MEKASAAITSFKWHSECTCDQTVRLPKEDAHEEHRSDFVHRAVTFLLSRFEQDMGNSAVDSFGPHQEDNQSRSIISNGNIVSDNNINLNEFLSDIPVISAQDRKVIFYPPFSPGDAADKGIFLYLRDFRAKVGQKFSFL